MMLVSLIIFLLIEMQTRARGEEVRCRPSLAESTSRAMRLGEALIVTQCHLGCVNKVLKNATIALELAQRENQPWPHLDTSDILVHGGCNTLDEVVECRRGCGIRLQNLTLSRNDCREQCNSECRDACGNETCSYPGSSCTIDCKKKACGIGCILAKELSVEHSTTGAPLTPDHTFSLVRSEIPSRPLAGGLYNITLSEDIDDVIGQDNDVISDDIVRESGLTVFMARVETNDTSYYFPLTDLGGVLDLRQFSCEMVNISFSAVNRYAMSAFSTAVELTVYGDRVMPTQLPYNGIQYEWVEDQRPGFEGTAVVNITWEPQEGSEFITSYEITVFSQPATCGVELAPINYVNIAKDATYFVWMSMSSPRMPVIGCTYQAQIRAMPCDLEAHELPIQIIKVDTRSMKDGIQPTMNMTCFKYVNETTGLISVFIQWEVQNTSLVLEAIQDYQIWTMLMDTRGKIPRALDVASGPKILANGSRMAYLVHGRSPDADVNHQIFLRIEPSSNEQYSWRKIPDYRECRVNIYPREPSVPGATVDSFIVNDTSVFLNLTLIPPAAPFGEIGSYEVVLVREPVPTGEDPLNLNLVGRTELQFDNEKRNGVLKTENVNSAYRHIDESTPCLYLHIRAKNGFLWSDWSDAVLLERHPTLYSNCSAIQEPQNAVALHTYVVISLCVVVVVVLSVLTAFTATRLYQRYRIRKQLRKAFQDPGYENPIFRRHDIKRRSSALWLPMDAPKADDWELPSANILITDEEPLGEGCFGLVHKGMVKGPILHSRTMKNTICINVAIKFLKKTATGSERSDFLTEIDTMKMVAEGNNPHVVNMIGCVTLQEPVCLVTEFVIYGDLLTYLTTIRRLMNEMPSPAEVSEVTQDSTSDKELDTTVLGFTSSPNKEALELTSAPDNTTDNVDDVDEGKSLALSPISQGNAYDRLNPYANLGDLEPVNIISFAYQIASGMEYLSSLGIIHRDLASRNILVGEGKQLKISDFGMARTIVDEVYVKSTKGRLPWKWMAMESIITREFTSASDVWSYGVTLWEIGTLGGFPYPTITNSNLLEYLRKGNRLECPPNCSSEIYDIMLKCWQEVPNKRPTFTDLKTVFAEMLQENNQYMQLRNISTRKPHYSTSAGPDELNSDMQLSGEGLSEEDRTSSPSSDTSSSSSLPLNAGNFDLIKGSAGVDLTSPEGQSSLIPPNLYVNTPTKTKTRPHQTTGDHSTHTNGDHSLCQTTADHSNRPSSLSLNLNTVETEV